MMLSQFSSCSILHANPHLTPSKNGIDKLGALTRYRGPLFIPAWAPLLNNAFHCWLPDGYTSFGWHKIRHICDVPPGGAGRNNETITKVCQSHESPTHFLQHKPFYQCPENLQNRSQQSLWSQVHDSSDRWSGCSVGWVLEMIMMYDRGGSRGPDTTHNFAHIHLHCNSTSVPLQWTCRWLPLYPYSSACFDGFNFFQMPSVITLPLFPKKRDSHPAVCFMPPTSHQ